ncbi:MAG: hypothetical protein PUP90_00745 [Nostoc sp. S4]|nr:hypothetical protein [Nostoc sp. S4]
MMGKTLHNFVFLKLLLGYVYQQTAKQPRILNCFTPLHYGSFGSLLTRIL